MFHKHLKWNTRQMNKLSSTCVFQTSDACRTQCTLARNSMSLSHPTSVVLGGKTDCYRIYTEKM